MIAGRISRFVASGAIGAAIDLALLFALTEYARVWYFASAAVAFAISQGASFALQKHWTFGDRSRDRMRRQASVYLAIGLANLAVNSGLMYVFVGFWGIGYILAQALASAVIAVYSYLAYGRIFKDSLSPCRPDRGPDPSGTMPIS